MLLVEFDIIVILGVYRIEKPGEGGKQSERFDVNPEK